MMATSRFATALSAVIALALPTATVCADDLSPVVVASIHDEPLDGYGDSFNGAFPGLLRQQSYREDRAIQEYDVSPYAGMMVTSAEISGTIYVNNGGGDWPRIFDFIIYDGNGQADLSDFEIAGTVVGVETWPQDSGPLAFSFDVTAEVQDLLDGGGEFVGLKVDPTSENSFPSILDGAGILSIEAVGGIPGDLDGDGDVDLTDLALLLASYGIDDGGDIDGDGDTDLTDLATLLAHYGEGT
jgi:hypothetical protein